MMATKTTTKPVPKRTRRRPTASTRGQPAQAGARTTKTVTPVALDETQDKVVLGSSWNERMVRMDRRMAEALHYLPDLLDRARYVAPALGSIQLVAEIVRARSYLTAMHERLSGLPADADVLIDRDFWETIRDWPRHLERARTTPGIRFALAELDAIVLTRTLWPTGEEPVDA